MGAKKKYYGYKKPEVHYTITLNDDVGKSTGTMLSIEFGNSKFSIVKVNRGQKRIMSGPVMVKWNLICIFDAGNTYSY